MPGRSGSTDLWRPVDVLSNMHSSFRRMFAIVGDAPQVASKSYWTYLHGTLDNLRRIRVPEFFLLLGRANAYWCVPTFETCHTIGSKSLTARPSALLSIGATPTSRPEMPSASIRSLRLRFAWQFCMLVKGSTSGPVSSEAADEMSRRLGGTRPVFYLCIRKNSVPKPMGNPLTALVCAGSWKHMTEDEF